MAFFSMRCERVFCAQLRFNMLFRSFLDIDMIPEPFVPTVLTHNGERFLRHDVARAFLGEVVRLTRSRRLLSEEHFSVDGTLIESWASMKSSVGRTTTAATTTGLAPSWERHAATTPTPPAPTLTRASSARAAGRRRSSPTWPTP